jgi:hypothetical protein
MIADGIRDHRIAYDVEPLRDGNLRGDHSGGARAIRVTKR